MYGKAYSNLLISENAFNTVCRLEEELAPVFRRIESIECENELTLFLLFFRGCFGTAIYSLPFPESHMILWLMR